MQFTHTLMTFASIQKDFGPFSGFERDEASEIAFTTLKAKLINSPIVLAFPKWNSEFVLQVDASSIAVGAVLSQKNENGELQQIALFSSGLTSVQKMDSSCC